MIHLHKVHKCAQFNILVRITHTRANYLEEQGMTNAKSRDSSYYYSSEGGVRAHPLALSRSWAGWCSLVIG